MLFTRWRLQQVELKIKVRYSNSILTPANRYGFTILFSAETDNLQIYS